jgi:hypothetical protein
MLKRTILLIVLIMLVQTDSAQMQSRSARVRSVTGHYRTRHPELRNSLEVQQLAGEKIKFHILALWVSANNPDNIHNGELQGIIPVKDNVALYESDNCKVTIRFTPSGAMVTQADEVGDCDFGANVTAAGNYRKLDSRRPKFDF